uniref:Interleukin 12 receptor, beta 2a n=1 Tax=Myripristis murdjan TaxID=586833 RepID=A0A667XFZ1_9TELE
MATIPQTWSVLTVITVLAVQFCDKSCVIWSSSGSDVLQGSSFEVYCTFTCNCKGSMYADNVGKPQEHRKFNSTTLYLNVRNITERRTFSCQCNDCRSNLDPCGLDIFPGYPPDMPQNITCFQNVINGEKEDVVCTWNTGRNTQLDTVSELCVRTTSGNHTDGPFSCNNSTKGPDLSVRFPVSASVQTISVKVQTHNKLGTAESPTFSYTLHDISKTSAISHKCSSQACKVTVGQRTKHLEIQYSTSQQTWTSHPESGVQIGSVWIQSISSLQPYTLYHFRARTKLSTGLWSQWSTQISNWTQEEAPDKELDVWYADSPESNCMTVYWKRLNDSNARGKIVDYRVKGHNLKTDRTFAYDVSANVSHYSVPCCGSCEVTVFVRNSKGLSPPAILPSFHKTAEPPQDVHVTVDNHSVIISWRKPVTAFAPTAYLVEWHPEDRRVEELQWVRLGRNENQAVITDMKPYECYEGAVYVLYESSVGRARFTGVSTMESAPTGGPSVKEQVEGNKVTLTWTKLPREQRRGCISNYTIHLKTQDSLLSCKHNHIPPSETMYIIKHLPPASYWLQMSAWTSHGEGPAGRGVKFFIERKNLILSCPARFWMVFRCLMLDVIPDPANSKWAQECQGKMNFPLQLSNSCGTEEEDEPVTVDVEELHEEDFTPASDVSSQLCPQTSLSPTTETDTLLYPHTSYIKSFSHDSDSSDQTQTSLETNTTLDYIAAHWAEDEECEEDEIESTEMFDFFPSPMDALMFKGQLTLDTVKIDCIKVFTNSFGG